MIICCIFSKETILLHKIANSIMLNKITLGDILLFIRKIELLTPHKLQIPVRKLTYKVLFFM